VGGSSKHLYETMGWEEGSLILSYIVWVIEEEGYWDYSGFQLEIQ
jgi:hypothetical protein